MKTKTLGIVAVVIVVLGSVVWLVTKSSHKTPESQEMQSEIAPSDAVGAGDYQVPAEDEAVAPEDAPSGERPAYDAGSESANPAAGSSETIEVESTESDDLGN